MPASAISKLGITSAAEPSKLSSTNTCLWRVDKGSIRESYAIGVTHYRQRGLDDIVSSQAKTPLKIGARDAVQSLEDSGGACFVAIGLTKTTRVDVRVIGEGKTRLCPIAVDAAKLIEPELP